MQYRKISTAGMVKVSLEYLTGHYPWLAFSRPSSFAHWLVDSFPVLLGELKPVNPPEGEKK